jgi:hypothetical protein
MGTQHESVGFRMHLPRHGTALALLSVILLASAPVTAQEPSLDAAFVAGLRERKLFELAERYCVDRINSSQTPDAERADLAVELVRTLATHAGNVPRAQRTTFWQAAQSAAADFSRRFPTHPRLVLVQTAAALVPLAQGDLAWREREAALLPTGEIEAARQALADAAQSLADLDKFLAREIVARRRTPPPAGGISADERRSLRQQVQYHKARARRLRGLFYEPGSDDRLAQLVAARQLLEPLQAEVAADDVLAALVRLELAEVFRLAGKLVEATEALAGLDEEGTSAGVRLQARAAAIRLAISGRNTVGLRRLVESGDLADGQASPELDLARLEASLRLDDPAQAAAIARRIDERHGEYWSRRVAIVLADFPASGSRLDDQQLLARRADGLVMSGKLDEALAAYDRAGELARAGKDETAAFEMAYKAALVAERLKQPAESVRRLRAASSAAPQHPQAAEAHLRAAFRARGTSDEGAILREHLSTWPAAPTAGQAHMWLGQLAESSGKWQQALDHYAAVPGSAAAYAQASGRLAELAKEQPDSGPVQEGLATSLLRSADPKVLRAALSQWQQIASRSAPNSPRWLKAHYSAARAHLKLGDKAAAARVLREVLDQRGGLSDAGWREKYAALLKEASE